MVLQTRDEIILAWINFLEAYLPNSITMVNEEDNNQGPQPACPYIGLKIIAGPTPFNNEDELRDCPDDPSFGPTEFALSGLRQVTITLRAFGKEAFDLLGQIVTLLDHPLVREQLRAEATIAIVDRGTPIDVSALLETSFQKRGSLDIIFNVANNLKIELDTIEKVATSGTIEGGRNGIKTIDVFEVDKP